MNQPQIITAYFDSSALVKRYLVEPGTAWVQSGCNDPGQTVALAEVGLVEIAAAFARNLREGLITQVAYRDVRTDLTIDAQDEYILVTVNRSLVDEAIELTARRNLRGYDAIHLACALRLNRALIDQNLASLTFISADDNLLAAATAEGLYTDNPNQHP